MEPYVPELCFCSKNFDMKIAASKDNTLIVSATSVYCDENMNFYHIPISGPKTPTFKEKA